MLRAVVVTAAILCWSADANFLNPLTWTGCHPGEEEENGVCAECAAGKYENASICLDCPLGQKSDEGSTSCEACPAGSYALRGACFACQLGRAQPAAGSTTCEPCDPGTHAPHEGAITCVPCPRGTAQSESGAEQCQTCTPGTHQPHESSTSCEPCAAGNFQSEQGSTSCNACPPGQVASQIGSTECSLCQAGSSTASGGASTCEPCAAGRYQDFEGRSNCRACERGRFQSGTGTTECEECQPGFHQENEGSSQECQACAAGTFMMNEGRGMCDPCPVGRSQPETGATSCTRCQANTFSNEMGKSTCDACASGRYQPDLGSLACVGCPAGRHGFDGGCTDCEQGRFQTRTSMFSCDLCPAGRFQTATGALTCEFCPAGHSSEMGASECDRCEPGTYQAPGGHGACQECPPGKFQTEKGATGCDDCPSGTAQEQSGATTCSECAAGTFEQGIGHSICDTCPAGEFVEQAGSATCSRCSAGRYKRNRTAVECTQCSPGTAQAYDGMSRCDMCFAGKFQTHSGQLACEDCETGTYQNETGGSRCSRCPSGKFEAGTGATDCEACAAGKYQNGTGYTSCHFCEAGTYSEGGYGDCSACPAGRFGDNNGMTVCTTCPLGKYQAKTGQLQCEECPRGTHQNLTGGTECFFCSSGVYQDEHGQSVCKACPAGMYMADTGAKKCKRCEQGTFQAGTGHSACDGCAAGKFQALEGFTYCDECAPGTFQPESGHGSCLNCEAGKFTTNAGATAEECQECPAGTFQAEPGRSYCERCAAGSYSNAIGVSKCRECDLGKYRPAGEEHGGCHSCEQGRYAEDTGMGSCKSCPEGHFQPQSGASLCETCPAGKWFHHHTGATTDRFCDACPGIEHAAEVNNVTAANLFKQTKTPFSSCLPSPLVTAVQSNSTLVATIFINRLDADPHVVDEHGHTLVRLAAETCNLDMMTALVDHGVSSTRGHPIDAARDRGCGGRFTQFLEDPNHKPRPRTYLGKWQDAASVRGSHGLPMLVWVLLVSVVVGVILPCLLLSICATRARHEPTDDGARGLLIAPGESGEDRPISLGAAILAEKAFLGSNIKGLAYCVCFLACIANLIFPLSTCLNLVDPTYWLALLVSLLIFGYMIAPLPPTMRLSQLLLGGLVLPVDYTGIARDSRRGRSKAYIFHGFAFVRVILLFPIAVWWGAAEVPRNLSRSMEAVGSPWTYWFSYHQQIDQAFADVNVGWVNVHTLSTRDAFYLPRVQSLEVFGEDIVDVPMRSVYLAWQACIALSSQAWFIVTILFMWLMAVAYYCKPPAGAITQPTGYVCFTEEQSKNKQADPEALARNIVKKTLEVRQSSADDNSTEVQPARSVQAQLRDLSGISFPISYVKLWECLVRAPMRFLRGPWRIQIALNVRLSRDAFAAVLPKSSARDKNPSPPTEEKPPEKSIEERNDAVRAAVLAAAGLGLKEKKEELAASFQPGPLGITYWPKTGLVTEVFEGGQAQRAGVKVDWFVDSIGGEPYDHKLFVNYRHKDQQGTGYVVKFVSKSDVKDVLTLEETEPAYEEEGDSSPRTTIRCILSIPDGVPASTVQRNLDLSFGSGRLLDTCTYCGTEIPESNEDSKDQPKTPRSSLAASGYCITCRRPIPQMVPTKPEMQRVRKVEPVDLWSICCEVSLLIVCPFVLDLKQIHDFLLNECFWLGGSLLTIFLMSLTTQARDLRNFRQHVRDTLAHGYKSDGYLSVLAKTRGLWGFLVLAVTSYGFQWQVAQVDQLITALLCMLIRLYVLTNYLYELIFLKMPAYPYFQRSQKKREPEDKA